MASTHLITCIHSALDVVDFLLIRASNSDLQKCRTLRFKLRNLKTFLLCARKLGNDGNLRSLLVRIEDTVRTHAGHIRPHCLQLNVRTVSYLHMDLAAKFETGIETFENEIDEWYVTMSNQYTPRYTTNDHVLEIISSFLMNLADFRSLIGRLDGIQVLVHTMEAFELQMSFTQSLISLASNRRVEPLEDLLAHAEAITNNASHLLFRCRSEDYQELQFEMSELLQKIKPADSHVYNTYTRALSSSKLQSRLLDSTRDMDDDAFAATNMGFLDCVISTLWDQLTSSTCVPMRDLQDVYEGLRSLRSNLRQQQPDVVIKEAIGDVLCDIGIFICSLHHKPIQVYSIRSILVRTKDFLCDVAVFICSIYHTHKEEEGLELKNLLDAIRSILVQVGEAEEPQFFKSINKEHIPAGTEEEVTGVKGESGTYQTPMPSQGDRSTTTVDEQVVGFHDDQRLIVHQLTRGFRRLQIVAIVGMPGLGKTTLARTVYTDPSVSHYFPVRAWSSISQVVDKRKVILDLMSQIDPRKCSEMSSEQDLAETLRKSLKGRRYLIFLDDMWEAAAWDLLKESFPDDNVGSRIILTSRQYDVAPHDLMFDQKPHSLRPLNEEDSLKLLQMKLSSGLSPDLGMKIAGKCRGLPLLIVIVAGVLKNIEPEGWDEMLDGLRNLSSTDMQCRNTLNLSYKHLPAYLRQCLLYFGVFPEDEEVSVRKLIRLWIAEGFVNKEDKMSLEQAAEGYLDDLISRSLVMVAKRRSDGGVKTCRIHDLLHEFCQQKAKNEHFFHFLIGYDELSAFNELHSNVRLCIHSDIQHFIQSKLFCPRARSLVLNMVDSQWTWYWLQENGWVGLSSAIQTFKLLTVLDIEQVDLGFRFPTGIEWLLQLTFLAIQCDSAVIPSLIGNLSNLQTFIMQYGVSSWPTSLPDSLRNLQKLQYLYIGCSLGGGGGVLSQIHFNSAFVLHALERLSGIVIPHSEIESQLRMFPNIRKLKCILSRDWYGTKSVKIVVPDTLSRLESLHISYDNILSHLVSESDEFIVPAHLKKLTLGNFRLSWKNLSTIGELPNLEVLKLELMYFEGETWEMKEGEFPRLKILKLARLELVKWVTESDDQLDCFQKLVLEQCSCVGRDAFLSGLYSHT